LKSNIAQIYTFQNIRFAQPPVGKLRFRKPEPLTNIPGIQTGETGNLCVQLVPSVGINVLDDFSSEPYGPFVNEVVTTFASQINDVTQGGDEDCLFLDLYVPGKAIRDATIRLPVVNYIYGGAFLLGGMDPYGVYNPTRLMSLSEGNFIWVAGNYRLGAYGWIGGKTIEKIGTPNMGLHGKFGTSAACSMKMTYSLGQIRG
jgi:carboxylesterase type B